MRPLQPPSVIGRSRGFLRTARERGVILVVTMLMLMVISLVGVATMQNSAVEESITGSLQDQTLALQAAEAAMRDAWFDIQNTCASSSSNCTLRTGGIVGGTNFGDASSTSGTCSSTGLCMPSGTYPNYGQISVSNWSSLNPVTYGTYTMSAAPNPSNLSQQPQYVIEAMCSPDSTVSVGGVGCPRWYYRVTARGWGKRATTFVTLQAIYRPQ
jgi:type IV pilus assembly protein PilX